MRRREAPLSRRGSGVLLHVTSLPGGRLGREAYEFVEWLEEAGQSWWQVLPLNPPDAFGSPYTSSSAFAGWRGLLAEPDADVGLSEIRDFRARHAYWAEDWERYAGAGALADQVRFEREWGALRAYAAAHGVSLIGDIPIYVAEESAEVDRPSRAVLPRPRRGRGTRRLAPRRAAVGPARLRLGRHAARGLPLVDRALPPVAGAHRRRPRRPLPRLRRLLGGSARREEPARRALAPRPRREPCSRRSSGTSATCR